MKTFLSLVLFVAIFLMPIKVQAQNWATEYQNNSRNAVISTSDEMQDLVNRATITPTLQYFELPVYSNGIIYISERNLTGGYLIRAIDKITGNKLWQIDRAVGKLGSTPVIADGYIIIPATTLICADAKTGNIIWESFNPYSNFVFRYPIVIGQDIFIWNSGSGSGAVVSKYDLLTGVRNTNFSLSFSIQTLFPMTSDGSSLVVLYGASNNASYVGSYDLDGHEHWKYNQASNPSGPIVVDGGNAFLANVVGELSQIDLATGALVKKVRSGANATIPIVINGFAYFLTTSQYETAKGGESYLNVYNIATGNSDRLSVLDDLRISNRTTLINLAGNLYFATENGKIYKYEIENGHFESFEVNPNSPLVYLIMADGIFLSLSGNNSIMHLSSDLNYEVNGFKEIEIDSPYTCGDCNQYLGQLHSHYKPDAPDSWVYGNGEPFPAFTALQYRERGYDFMALTEHDEVVAMPVTDGILQIQNAEESTPEGWGKHHILGIGVTDRADFEASDQDRIDSIARQDGIPILAHPDSWIYGALSQTIARLTNLSHMEVYTHGVYKSRIPDAYALDDFDNLRTYYNKNYFLTAADDYTPGNPGFDGGAVVVLAHSNTQSEIISSLKNGNFYALQGSEAPRINISSDDSTITISASEPSRVSFIGDGGKILYKANNVQIATYTVVGNENYVRAEVKSAKTGKTAWTQPFDIENSEQATVSAGNHVINLDQAIIVSNTSGEVTADILSSGQYPKNFPPVGYLSPVYSLSTTGILSSGNQITISYDNKKLPVNADNLSIYYFNEEINTWEKIPTVLDKAKKTATAQLSHFSLYTLSAEYPEDIEPPVIERINPSDLSDISCDTEVEVMVSDDQAIDSIKFSLDGRYLSTDSDPNDGWSTELLIAEIIAGNHTLHIVAEDFSGNKIEVDYNVVANSENTAPSISIITPIHLETVSGSGMIQGTYKSSLAIDTVSIYLNDLFIANAVIDGSDNSFSLPVDWESFKEGDYVLKAMVADIYGNTAETELAITIGQDTEVSILSPGNREYYHSESIKAEIVITGNSTDVKILLDGETIENNTNIELINLSLGTHSIEVIQEEDVLTSVTFSIVTDYSDTIDVVKKLYKDGFIKNKGVTKVIISRLRVAEIFQESKFLRIEKKMLQHIYGYVEHLTEKKKPLITDYAKNIILDHILNLLLGTR